MFCVSDNYKLYKKLGSGSFGEVWLAENKKGKLIAVKSEEKNATSRLVEEYIIYKELKNKGVKQGIPKIYDFVETPQFNILTMELLGESLDELFNKYKRQFDLSTALALGVNIVTLLESIHNVGFIHRDIKPNNFMIGHDDKKDKLYIMDFGLSKQFMSKRHHINIRSERSLVGTARYTSVSVHQGIEPARRDDLESVGYMLVYFLKGSLPWQGLKKKEGVDQIKVIGDKKMCTSIEKLCKDIPECFMKYIKYCKNLNFDETPNYTYLKSLFIEDAKKLNINMKYCWV